MHFTILRDTFLKPLRAVIGVVERKHTQSTSILTNVLIKVEKNHFSLTATDQEVELVAEGSLDEAALKEGAVTVSARKLIDVVKALPEAQNLSIVQEGEKLVLRAGRSRFALATLPVADFPNLNEQVGQFEFIISKKKLRTLIDQISFAMAEQDVRYYLNGMLLEVKNGCIYGVAADGHRLAFGKVMLSSNNADSIRVIVPRKGIFELQRILDDSDQEVKIILGNNHLRIITPEVQLTSKLLDGRFPDYERIVLTEGNKVFTGRREALKECFQRAAALFSDKFKGVRLRLTQGSLKILAINSEQEEAEEDLEIDYLGNELEISLNIKYLIDFLQVIQTENIKFTFSDPNSSARVEGVGAESGIYIIMPMRI